VKTYLTYFGQLSRAHFLNPDKPHKNLQNKRNKTTDLKKSKKILTIQYFLKSNQKSCNQTGYKNICNIVGESKINNNFLYLNSLPLLILVTIIFERLINHRNSIYRIFP
jgi:hypothetical protein